MKTLLPILSVMTALAFCPAIASADVLFEDTFTSADPSWGFDSVASVQNGTLVVKPATGNSENYEYGANIYSDADISVTVSTTSTDGGTSAGVLFWGQDYNNYFVAQVNADGTFGIDRLFQNRWLTLLGSTASPAIIKTAGAKNVVRVVTKGSQITLYMNGTQVTSVKSQAPSGGGLVGIFAEAGADSPTWTIQDFKVSSVP